MSVIDAAMIGDAQTTLDRANWSAGGERYRSIARLIAAAREVARAGVPLDAATLREGVMIWRAADDCGIAIDLAQIVRVGPAGREVRYRATPRNGTPGGVTIEGTAAELAVMLRHAAPAIKWLARDEPGEGTGEEGEGGQAR